MLMEIRLMTGTIGKFKKSLDLYSENLKNRWSYIARKFKKSLVLYSNFSHIADSRAAWMRTSRITVCVSRMIRV